MKTAQSLSIGTSSSSSSTRNNVRVELFFSSTAQLRERISFLRSKGVTSYNLVNKSNTDDILQSVQVIEEEFPDECHDTLSVCAHYSLKYNKSRKMDGALSMLKDFVGDMNKFNAKKNEILIITGSGAKGKFNSLTAMQRLQKEKVDMMSTCMAVAFNPFFPDENDYKEEKTRLMQKLNTGIVTKVYLQFGTDLERLRDALQKLTELQSISTQRFDISGSVFLPTKKLIAQQKFRPWNGVFLSDEFLSSEDGARGIVLQMMRLYEKFGCEILIEAPGVRNEKDWALVESLLQERDGLMASSATAKTPESENIECEDKDSATAKRRKTNKVTTKPVSMVPSKSNIPSTTMSAGALAKPGLLLFNSHDVRTHDNVAFQMASHHEQVIPVFLWSKEEQGNWGATGCLEVVLKDALRNLDAKLKQNGLRLVCREGVDSAVMLKQICHESDAGAVYWNKEHTPESKAREEKYRSMLNGMNIEHLECQSSLLYDPLSPTLSSGFHGGHWGTLMPFLKGCKKQLGEPRVPIPRSDTFYMLESMKGPDTWPQSTNIDKLKMAVIKGEDKWDEPILKRFPMSEDEALADMNSFYGDGFAKYERERSRADIESSTSKLSAHLRIGTLSPNEFYHKIESSKLEYNERRTISRRLVWRDLAYYHLASFPDMRDKSIRLHYDDTEWCSPEEEEKRFNCWKKGQTGYPLVDAGMRELRHTGWMTQSVRMVVASFLCEHLRVNWVRGAEYFHYTLVDADSAINSMMVSLRLHVQDVVFRQTHRISFAVYVSGKMLAEGKIFNLLFYSSVSVHSL